MSSLSMDQCDLSGNGTSLSSCVQLFLSRYPCLWSEDSQLTLSVLRTCHRPPVFLSFFLSLSSPVSTRVFPSYMSICMKPSVRRKRRARPGGRERRKPETQFFSLYLPFFFRRRFLRENDAPRLSCRIPYLRRQVSHTSDDHPYAVEGLHRGSLLQESE